MLTKHPTLPPIVHPVDPKLYFATDESKPRRHPERVMSQSSLKDFAVCPHRWVAGYKEEETDEMKDGKLVDVIMLTPERFEAQYEIAPVNYPVKPTAKDPRTEKPWNSNSTWCKDWIAEAEERGASWVKPKAAEEAWKAREILHSNPRLHAFHEGSKKQVQFNVVWEDPETGIVVPIKGLIDLLPDAKGEFGKMLADFKRTNNAEYRMWARTVHSFGLHYQAAFYLDAYNAATGEKRNQYEHHVQESVSPFETTHRELSFEFLTLGRTRYQSDLANYCRALKTGVWMGYDTAIVEPEVWMMNQ